MRAPPGLVIMPRLAHRAALLPHRARPIDLTHRAALLRHLAALQPHRAARLPHLARPIDLAHLAHTPSG